MGSKILGKGLRENAPAGRAKLRREIRLPISNNYARHSTLDGITLVVSKISLISVLSEIVLMLCMPDTF